jgi:ethanolamine utilization protein EutN
MTIMQLARVIGTAISTVKHPSLVGAKMLVVAPLMADRQAIDGDPIIAVDGVGAGHGEIVMVTSDGSHAGELLARKDSPVRWTICGIVD